MRVSVVDIGSNKVRQLSKCYEPAIRQRALATLANIDDELCRQVAAGLGLPAPRATVTLADPQPSPALSQLGHRWPVDGRTIGIVAAEGSDLAGVRQARQAVFDAGMVPLVIAATGRPLGSGADQVLVQRTFAATRSIEYDAILVAAAPAAPTTPPAGGDADPRVALMLTEAYRHGKALGAWGDGIAGLVGAGIAADAPGVVTATDAGAVLEQITELLAEHRVWGRFAPAA